MDWFHWIMLGLGTFYVVFAPVVLVKAIQRREWQRLFELVVTTLFTSGFVLSVVSPIVVQNAWDAWPPLRWLYLLSVALMFVNMFGFSGWLFNRNRKRQT